ncbi:fdxN element excision controlling factor protein [Pseudanabaena sp. ABRG5-3]|nr:element excision factor XisI family protein [Pseudanabaena sp. ABRG5-3]BBC24751.1 fdxN element excision controlling factor protein [Pseudanabaena sp. ABRG5-3]
MHLDIKNGKIWIQINNTELDIGQALVEKGVPKEDIVIGFQPVYIRQAMRSPNHKKNICNF